MQEEVENRTLTLVKVYTFVSNLYPLGGVTSFTEYVPSSSGVDKVAWPAVSVVKVATTEPVPEVPLYTL